MKLHDYKSSHHMQPIGCISAVNPVQHIHAPNPSVAAGALPFATLPLFVHFRPKLDRKTVKRDMANSEGEPEP